MTIAIISILLEWTNSDEQPKLSAGGEPIVRPPPSTENNMSDEPASKIAMHQRQTRICVAGPGAIGTTLATRIAMAGFEVTVVARGESLQKIKASGVRLLDGEGDHSASVDVSNGNDLGKQDIIFLCSKAQDLVLLAGTIQDAITQDTIVVPVINGIPWWYFQGDRSRFAGRTVSAVDPDGKLQKIIPSKNVVGCVAMFTAERLEPGFARALNPIKLVIGEIDDKPRARSKRLFDLLLACGVETKLSDRIRDPLWTKVIANLMSNPLSVVTQAPLRDVCGDAHLGQISRKLLEEGLLIAASFGARSELEPDRLLAFGASMGDAKTSMLQDFESGRPLELDAICEAVVELGELQGLSMPLTRHIAILAKYKSENTNR